MTRTRVTTRWAVAVVAAVAMLLAGTPAHAVATWYYFYPGHPTYFGGPKAGGVCTGGYAIRGASGMFFLSDSHCAGVGAIAYGTGSRFGTFAYSRHDNPDTALIQPDSGVDALQIVVNHKTGASPGRIVGIYDEAFLGVGVLVGKMGDTTGWTEGHIYGTIIWKGMIAYCAHAANDGAFALAGDSGGPVWRTGPNGVLAVGIMVAGNAISGDACFYPIKRVVDEWGAWLPDFSEARAAVIRPPGRAVPPTPPPIADDNFVPLVGR